MRDSIVCKAWEFLAGKQVSLAMIFDIDGNILWHKGRKVTGDHVDRGRGFAGSFIKEAVVKGNLYREDPLEVTLDDDKASESMVIHFIKCLLIKQISDDCFLYLDSTRVASFNPQDRETFYLMAEMIAAGLDAPVKRGAAGPAFTGSSATIEEIRRKMQTYAVLEDPLLLTGETGTGKTFMAELIHNLSGRPGPFVVLNAPSIPETLFESELFGHKKGAFTNANCDRKGLIEAAHGGTLLIDEISEVSIALQAKLLRFLDTGRYSRLGESIEKEANVRVLAATNKDLHEAIWQKEFREDLYYRLSVFEINLPPLRAHKEDLEDLVKGHGHCLNGKKIGPGFWQALADYHWPGNVRELISVLKRAGMIDKHEVRGGDIEEIIKGSFRRRIPGQEGDGDDLYLWMEIKNGKDFWQVAKGPYMNRELKRSEVQRLIARGLQESGGLYKGLIKIFNLKEGDYHRFMRFIHEQDLKPLEELRKS